MTIATVKDLSAYCESNGFPPCGPDQNAADYALEWATHRPSRTPSETPSSSGTPDSNHAETGDSGDNEERKNGDGADGEDDGVDVEDAPLTVADLYEGSDHHKRILETMPAHSDDNPSLQLPHYATGFFSQFVRVWLSQLKHQWRQQTTFRLRLITACVLGLTLVSCV